MANPIFTLTGTNRSRSRVIRCCMIVVGRICIPVSLIRGLIRRGATVPVALTLGMLDWYSIYARLFKTRVLSYVNWMVLAFPFFV